MNPTQSGDTFTLYRADYLDTLRTVAEQGGADLIATSPPYADARTYGMDCSFTDADYQRLAHGLWDALKPGGHALINLDAPVRDWAKDGRGTERGLHPWRFMLYAHDVVGFRVPDRLAFGRMGQVGRPAGRFRNDWEPLLWFVKPGCEPYHAPDAIALPSVYGIVKSQRRKGADCLEIHRDNRGNPLRKVVETVLPGTLWNYGAIGTSQTGAPDIEAADHPARWPYKLARDIVLCFCPPGGIVCDPFLGAGTTMIAALEEKRRFVGGDLGARQTDGKAWVDVAADLWAERLRQGRLFGGAP